MIEKACPLWRLSIRRWFVGECRYGFTRSADGKGEAVFGHHTEIAEQPRMPERSRCSEGVRVIYKMARKQMGVRGRRTFAGQTRLVGLGTLSGAPAFRLLCRSARDKYRG